MQKLTLIKKNVRFCIIFLISGICLILKVQAMTCEQSGCSEYGKSGCYYDNPGIGGGTHCSSGYCDNSVTSDSSSPTYCSNQAGIWGVNATNRSNNGCTSHKNISYRYCKKGYGPIATTSGRLYVYSDRSVNVNGKIVGPGINIDTGINVTQGQSIYIAVTTDGYTNTPGWIYDPSSPWNSTILANGQTIISSQSWGDDINYDGSSVYNYETFDFTDAYVTLTVKKLDCNNSDISLSSSAGLQHLILGVNPQITFYKTFNASASMYKMNSNDLSLPSALSNCNFVGLGYSNYSNSVTCKVQLKPSYPNTAITWSHSWCNTSDGSCSGKKICSQSLTYNVDNFGAYLYTTQGNVFVRQSINLPRFPISSQFFSTYNYAYQGSYNPIGSNSWLSKNKYIAQGYDDHNSDASFYNTIYNRIGSNGKKLPLPSTNLSSSTSNLTGSKNVVEITGDLNINSGSLCDSRTIFFVSNNLIFNSNFSISGDNACLFVVQGHTYVAPSVTNINAFIITNGFTSQITPLILQALTIKGGLIVQSSSNLNFYRNINLTQTNVDKLIYNTPSEIINYEGARYIKLLADLLNEPQKINIREVQYTGKSN